MKKGKISCFSCKTLFSGGSTLFLMYIKFYNNSRYPQFPILLVSFGYSLVNQWLFMVTREEVVVIIQLIRMTLLHIKHTAIH